MQDAHVKNWARERPVSVEMLESTRELNHRFLDLVGMPSSTWSATARGGWSTDVSGQVAPLSAAQKKAAADCPYALFDLRFYNARYWHARLQPESRWSVADEVSVDENIRNFARLALFFAWHVASAGGLAAQLLLGMNEDTAAAFRGVTIDCVPTLAATEAINLTARWNHCPKYWSALAAAASRPNPAQLRRIQLYGLQLAAAERLV
jgi:hypothetical protein